VADRQQWDEAVASLFSASCCVGSDMPGGSGQRMYDEQTLSRPGV
jgi:hypothetical protein